MSSNIINTIRLSFDIIGVIVLFKFGLPSDVSKTGSVGFAFQEMNHSEIRKWKKYNFWPKVGLTFILIGFILQIFSNFKKC